MASLQKESRRYYSAPLEYLNNMRIRQARQLLDLTTLKISEITGQPGFSDPLEARYLFIAWDPSAVAIAQAEYHRCHNRFRHFRSVHGRPTPYRSVT